MTLEQIAMTRALLATVISGHRITHGAEQGDYILSCHLQDYGDARLVDWDSVQALADELGCKAEPAITSAGKRDTDLLRYTAREDSESVVVWDRHCANGADVVCSFPLTEDEDWCDFARQQAAFLCRKLNKDEELPAAERATNCPATIASTRVPVYNGHEHDFSQLSTVELRTEAGLRVILGDDLYDRDRADFLIERQPKGWLIMVTPDGGDEHGGLLITDDGGRREVFAYSNTIGTGGPGLSLVDDEHYERVIQRIRPKVEVKPDRPVPVLTTADAMRDIAVRLRATEGCRRESSELFKLAAKVDDAEVNHLNGT